MTYISVRFKEISTLVTRSLASSGSKAEDFDVVTFTVLLNQTVKGAGVATTGGLFSGDVQAMAALPAKHTTGMTAKWLVAPFEVKPGDGLTIIYTGTNISSQNPNSTTGFGISQDKQSEIEIKVLDILLSAAVGAPEFGVIGAAIGSALGSIGDVVGKVLGFEETPNCDGLVFSDTVQFEGGALAGLDYGPIQDDGDASVPFKFGSEKDFSKSYTDSATHSSSCGAVAQTSVVFSVIKYDAISIEGWLPRLYPGKTFASVVSGQRPVSLKSLF